jgi:predicted nucleic acid-binding protein
MNQIIKVYADTNTLRANLARHPDNADKQRELAAMDTLDDMKKSGQISMEIFKSRVSRKEVERTKNPKQRANLQNDLERLQQIPQDEKLLGFNIQSDRLTFISFPLMSDILDEKLYGELIQRGLSPDDAHHISHAICNECDVFLTHDMKTIVNPYRQWLEEQFPIKVFLPSELLEFIAAKAPG